MATTASFLKEPQQGRIASAGLSAALVTRVSLLDATMFLAESAAPTALHMAIATRCRKHMNVFSDSADSIALNTSQSFLSVCANQNKLQRQ